MYEIIKLVEYSKIIVQEKKVKTFVQPFNIIQDELRRRDALQSVCQSILLLYFLLWLRGSIKTFNKKHELPQVVHQDDAREHPD